MAWLSTMWTRYAVMITSAYITQASTGPRRLDPSNPVFRRCLHLFQLSCHFLAFRPVKRIWCRWKARPWALRRERQAPPPAGHANQASLSVNRHLTHLPTFSIPSLPSQDYFSQLRHVPRSCINSGSSTYPRSISFQRPALQRTAWRRV